MGFRSTVGIGKLGEQFIQQLLSAAQIPSQLNPEKKNKSIMIEWDIEFFLGASRFTIEAKFDVMASKTGNLAIEYYNTKQASPSGITATTADLWAVVLKDPMSAWLARTSDLKDYFTNHRCLRDIACGGDNNAAMKLYPKEELLEAVFHRADGLSADKLLSLLQKLTNGLTNSKRVVA